MYCTFKKNKQKQIFFFVGILKEQDPAPKDGFADLDPYQDVMDPLKTKRTT